MSIAKALNLAIAIAEDNPEAGRGIMRSLPLDEMGPLSASVIRLRKAIDRREDQAVHDALLAVLRFTMGIQADGVSDNPAEAYLEGISTVEAYIDARLHDLKQDLKETE